MALPNWSITRLNQSFLLSRVGNREASEVLPLKFIGILGLFLVVACQGPRHEHRQTTGHALRPGWHLVSTASVSIPEGATVFQVDHNIDPASGQIKAHYTVVEEMEPHNVYWLHVGDGDKARRTEPVLALTPPTSKMAIRGDGRYFLLTSDLPRADLGAEEVFRWDAVEQELVRVGGESVLKKGQTYWVVPSDDCSPDSWRWGDAVRFLHTCPLQEMPSRIIRRYHVDETAVSEPHHQGSTQIVLHHTNTPSQTPIARWTLNTGGLVDNMQAHFVVALDADGAWQAYQTRRLPPLGQRLPESIHVALMGTIEPEASGEEVDVGGFPGEARRSDLRPGVESVLRLGQVVARLQTTYGDKITGVVPFGRGPGAIAPGASEGPGKATLHLVRALDARFFADGRIAPSDDGARAGETKSAILEAPSETPEDEDLGQGADSEEERDRTPPLLFVESPKETPSLTRSSSVAQERTVILDREPPILVVAGPQNKTVYGHTTQISGHVQDRHFERLVLNKAGTEEHEQMSVQEDGRFSVELALEPGTQRFEFLAFDKAGNVRKRTLNVEASPEPLAAKQPTGPPQGFFAWADGRSIHLRWRPPRAMEDGTPMPEGMPIRYRVYRDEETPVEVDTLFFEGEVPNFNETHKVYVAAVVDGREEPLVSQATSVATLHITEPLPGIQDGHFEPPSLVQEQGGQTSLVRVTTSAFEETGFQKGAQGERAFAHMVYVLSNSETQSDEIRYLRSDRLSKKDSWDLDAEKTFRANGAFSVTDLAISATGKKVALAWIEKSKQVSEGRYDMRLRVAMSENGGHSFSDPRTVAPSNKNKRHIDIAHDPSGKLHLVFEEAQKVYYLDGVDGLPSNVFDVQRRTPVDVVVDYYRDYVVDCPEDSESTCPCLKTEREVYSLGLEQVRTQDLDVALGCQDLHQEFPELKKALPPHPEGGYAYGPYLYSCEENFVTRPALHVDHEKVTIIAHQKFMWDNKRVQNPDWAHAHGPQYPPIDPHEACEDPLEGRRRDLMGFGQSFKRHVQQCDPSLPQNIEWLRATEATRGSTYDYYKGQGAYRGKGQRTLFSYDGAYVHEKKWYQYLTDGTWHDQDHIRIAQRPLRTGQWSNPQKKTVEVLKVAAYQKGTPPETFEPIERVQEEKEVEEGWRKGVWKDDRFQTWKVQDLEQFEAQDLHVEHGACTEDHQPTRRETKGPAHPKIKSTKDGKLVAVYERGDSLDPNRPGMNPIHFVHSEDGGHHWTPPSVIARGYMPQLTVLENGRLAVLYYKPQAQNKDGGVIHVIHSDDGQTWSDPQTLSEDPGTDAAGPVKPIHFNTHGENADTLLGVPALSFHEDLLVAAWITLPKGPYEKNQIWSTRAAWPDESTATLEMSAPRSTATAGQLVPLALECVNQYGMRVEGCAQDRLRLMDLETHAAVENPRPTPDRLGAHDLETQEPEAQEPRVATIAWSSDELPLAALASGTTLYVPTTEAGLSVAQEGDRIVIGAAHHRDSEDPLRDRRSDTQILTDNADGNAAKAHAFLNELLKQGGAQREYKALPGEDDSQPLSRFERVWVYTQGIALAQAASEGRYQEATQMANWLCDQAVHGAYQGEELIFGWNFSLNTLDDNWKDIRLVTGASAWALHGLGAFLSTIPEASLPEPGRAKLLTCYQKTLAGLKHHTRWTQEGERLLMTAGFTSDKLNETTDVHAYYNVLGGDLGYDIEDCHYTLDGNACPGDKAIVRAENVVTEHNLDVLSVLNHALRNIDALGLEHKADELRVFRNQLREGIFVDLWQKPAQDVRGRVITGGHFRSGQGFEATKLVAVDNCSWLSLSVNYAELEPRHQAKLAECLHFTIEEFLTQKEYDGQEFYGAHYFPRDFRDPYIADTEEAKKNQTELYHLEATAGVILGLWVFADQNLGHPAATGFRETANHVFAEMNLFVAAFGLPYSTRRIKNLMTRLPSATAAVWFLDLYHYHQKAQTDPDQPLKNYALGLNQNSADTAWANAARQFTEGAWNHLLDPSSQNRQKSSTKWLRIESYGEDRDGPPMHGALAQGAPDKNFLVRIERAKEAGRHRFVRLEATLPGQEDVNLFLNGQDTWGPYDAPVNVETIYAGLKVTPAEWGGLVPEIFDFTGIVDAIFEHPEDYFIVASIAVEEEEVVIGAARLRSAGDLSVAHIEKQLPLFWSGDVKKLSAGRPIARLVHRTRGLLATTGHVEAKTLEVVIESGWSWDRQREDAIVYVGEKGQWYTTERRPTNGDGQETRILLIHRDSGVEVEAMESPPAGSRGLIPSHLSEREGESGPSVSYLEDQALAIITAIHRGDTQRASTWVQGLLDAAVFEAHDGHQHLYFPSVVETESKTPLFPYYRTRTQMLCLYALLRFIEHSPRDGRVEDVRDVVRTGLATWNEMFYAGDRLLYRAGMGEPNAMAAHLGQEIVTEAQGNTGFGLFPVILEDNVFAYFTLELATQHKLQGDASHTMLGWAIQRSFVHPTEPRFRNYVPDDHDNTDMFEAETVSGLIAYVLFASHVGDLERAQTALDHLMRFRDLLDFAPQPGLGFIETNAGLVLAQRAVGAFDPRIEELARTTFQELIDLPDEHAGLATAALIAYDPQDFFGVYAGPLVLPKAQRTEVGAHTLEARFEALFAETIGRWLRAEQPADLTDKLFNRLIQLYSVYLEFVPERQDPWRTASYRDKVQDLRQALENLSEKPLPWLPYERLTTGLGVDGPLGPAFATLLAAHTGGQDVHLAPMIAHPHDAFERSRLHQALVEDFPGDHVEPQDGLFGNTVGFQPGLGAQTIDFQRSTEPKNVAAPSLSLLQEEGRAHLERAAEAAMAKVHEQGGTIWFELKGLDLIEIHNPASALYFSRAGIELRLATQQYAPNLRFTLRGVEVDAPEVLPTAQAQNVVFLRRLVNAHANGDLVAVAQKSQSGQRPLMPGEIHRMMRTGHIFANDLEAIKGTLALPENTWMRFFERFEIDESWALAVRDIDGAKGTLETLQAVGTSPLGDDLNQVVPIPESKTLEAAGLLFHLDQSWPAGYPCTDIYRFDAQNVPSDEDFLASEEQANKNYRIKTCHLEQQYDDHEFDRWYSQRVAECGGCVIEPLYAARIADRPWPEGFVGGVWFDPRNTSREGGARHLAFGPRVFNKIPDARQSATERYGNTVQISFNPLQFLSVKAAEGSFENPGPGVQDIRDTKTLFDEAGRRYSRFQDPTITIFSEHDARLNVPIEVQDFVPEASCPQIQSIPPLTQGEVKEGTLWTKEPLRLCQLQALGEAHQAEALSYAFFSNDRAHGLPEAYATVMGTLHSVADELEVPGYQKTILGHLHQREDGAPFPDTEDVTRVVEIFMKGGTPLSHIFPRRGGYTAGGPASDVAYTLLFGIPGTTHYQPHLWRYVYPDEPWDERETTWCQGLETFLAKNRPVSNHFDINRYERHCGSQSALKVGPLSQHLPDQACMIVTFSTDGSGNPIDIATCSADLVAEDMLMTAAHCGLKKELLLDPSVRDVEGRFMEAVCGPNHAKEWQSVVDRYEPPGAAHDVNDISFLIVGNPFTSIDTFVRVATDEDEIATLRSEDRCGIFGFGGASSSLSRKALPVSFMDMNAYHGLQIGPYNLTVHGDSGAGVLCLNDQQQLIRIATVTKSTDQDDHQNFMSRTIVGSHHGDWIRTVLKPIESDRIATASEPLIAWFEEGLGFYPEGRQRPPPPTQAFLETLGKPITAQINALGEVDLEWGEGTRPPSLALELGCYEVSRNVSDDDPLLFRAPVIFFDDGEPPLIFAPRLRLGHRPFNLNKAIRHPYALPIPPLGFRCQVGAYRDRWFPLSNEVWYQTLPRITDLPEPVSVPVEGELAIAVQIAHFTSSLEASRDRGLEPIEKLHFYFWRTDDESWFDTPQPPKTIFSKPATGWPQQLDHFTTSVEETEVIVKSLHGEALTPGTYTVAIYSEEREGFAVYWLSEQVELFAPCSPGEPSCPTPALEPTEAPLEFTSVDIEDHLPQQACAIGYIFDGERHVWCSGTLVSGDKVLTAAHCLTGTFVTSLGTFDLSNLAKEVRCGPVDARQWRAASDALPHPEYRDAPEVDVGFLTLKEPFTIDRFIRVATTEEEVHALRARGLCASFGWGMADRRKALPTSFLDMGLVRGHAILGPYNLATPGDSGAGVLCLNAQNELVHIATVARGDTDPNKDTNLGFSGAYLNSDQGAWIRKHGGAQHGHSTATASPRLANWFEAGEAFDPNGQAAFPVPTKETVLKIGTPIEAQLSPDRVSAMVDIEGGLGLTQSNNLVLEFGCYEPRQSLSDENTLLFRSTLLSVGDGPFIFGPTLRLGRRPFNLETDRHHPYGMPVPPFSVRCHLGTYLGDWIPLSNELWFHDHVQPRFKDALGTHVELKSAMPSIVVDIGALKERVQEFGHGIQLPKHFHIYFWRDGSETWFGENEAPSEVLGGAPRPWPEKLQHFLVPVQEDQWVIRKLHGETLTRGRYWIAIFGSTRGGMWNWATKSQEVPAADNAAE